MACVFPNEKNNELNVAFSSLFFWHEGKNLVLYALPETRVNEAVG